MTQAELILEKFGTVPQIQAALADQGFELERTTIYKWAYPKSKLGRDGFVPQKYHKAILDAAKKRGIKLSIKEIVAAGI
jgi:amino-acid N-acetyltransferase